MTPEIEQRHNDLQKTIDKLSNGHRGDPIAMSDGIVNISKTLQVMLKMNFVTEEHHKSSCEKLAREIKKNKFGWKHLMGVLLACSTLLALGSQIISSISNNNKTQSMIIKSITE